MPRQTRKEKLRPVEKPKARPARGRSVPKVKPRFKPEPPPKGIHAVTRMRCPMCNMITDIEDHVTEGRIIPGFKNVRPDFRIYDQVFGGRLPAPRGLKPGKKSKQAPGYMEYREITDPTSAEYQELVEIIKARMNDISEAILGVPLTLAEPAPIIPQKRKRKKPAK